MVVIQKLLHNNAIGVNMSNLIDLLLSNNHKNKKTELTIFDLSEENDGNINVIMSNDNFPIITSEFWTAKQRQANSIHEVSYRACFKPQLPNFFINLFTEENDIVYDPFNGRGTTSIEAALCNRNIIANDINPLSIILTEPRINIPEIYQIEERLKEITYDYSKSSDIDLSMFYEKKTLSEIVSLKEYLNDKKLGNCEDSVDKWIRMVATNKLTGHSEHFFSVYTLPPNQAISAEKQREINIKYNQIPSYKDTKNIILKKSKELQKNISKQLALQLKEINNKALYLNEEASSTHQIKSNSISLVVTSPPFLDVIDYMGDNWLRCWFNNINAEIVSQKIVVTKKIEIWNTYMLKVLKELYRIIIVGGYVAFEVGEVRGGKIKLDENIALIGKEAGFKIEAVIINKQEFTKTANIWGVKNNSKGTNTNRIVLMRKYD